MYSLLDLDDAKSRYEERLREAEERRKYKPLKAVRENDENPANRSGLILHWLRWLKPSPPVRRRARV